MIRVFVLFALVYCTSAQLTNCEFVYNGRCVGTDFSEAYRQCQGGRLLLGVCYYMNEYCCVGGGGGSQSTQRPTSGPTLSPQPGCGERKVFSYLQSRIINGENAYRGEFPWQVSLRYRGQHICGGSILNDRWIISAAHCFRDRSTYNYKIRVGGHIRTQSDGVDHSVRRIILHPDWNEFNLEGDVALVELTTKINMNSKYVNTICLPPAKELFANNKQCWVSGWGAINAQTNQPANTLQKLKAPVISNSACNQQHGGRINSKQVCQYKDASVSACRGDSGGPLICSLRGTNYLVGVVSWGPKSCSGQPAVYSRVSSYLGWLARYID